MPSRSGSGILLAIFLGSDLPPFNNHLKRTETQASEKQGNRTTMALLDGVVVVGSFVRTVDGGGAGVTRRLDNGLLAASALWTGQDSV